MVRLIKISKIFSEPSFDIFVDPWHLFIEHKWILQGDFHFRAQITDYSSAENITLQRDLDGSRQLYFDAPKNNEQSRSTMTSEGKKLLQQPRAKNSTQHGVLEISKESFSESKVIYEPWIYSNGGEYFGPCEESDEELYSSIESELKDLDISQLDHVSTVNSLPIRVKLPKDDNIPKTANSNKLYTSGSNGQLSSTSLNEVSQESHHSTDIKYVYQPQRCKQIRLFMLFPGLPDDPLRGSLQTVDLGTSMSYKALSYTWGSPTQLRLSLITPEGVLLIRESLSQALRSLRHQENPLVLWIDAICINQDDDQENVEQIKQLATVFQSAVCTLAFFGADLGSDLAIQTLLQIQANDTCGDDLASWPPSLPFIPNSWDERGVPAADDPIWLQIDAFFDRPWFRRSWIVQEAIVAPTVQIVCGSWAFDCGDLFGAASIIMRDSDFIPTTWEPFLKLGEHREFEARGIRQPLITLVEQFRHCQSQYRRDRLFSLLGLASDDNHEDFEPDYTARFETVMLRFAKAMVLEGSLMTLLHRAGLESQLAQCPSWIPNWTTEKAPSLTTSETRGVVFGAAGDSEESFIFTDDYTVDARGWLLGTIESISQHSNVPEQRRKYFEEIDTMVDGLVDSYRPSERSELKFSVPIAGAEHAPMSVPGDLDLQASYAAFRRILKKSKHKAAKENKIYHDMTSNKKSEALSTSGAGSAKPELQQESRQEKSSSYVALLDDNVIDWRFAIVGEDHCAVVPGNAQTGDVGAVFCGSDIPFVLRGSRSKDQTQMYRLGGECYVDGFMYGEIAVRGMEKTTMFQIH